MSRENVLVRLKELQRKNGSITNEALVAASQAENIPLNELYSAATFYSLLRPGPKGKYVIRLCQSLPCYMKGSLELLPVIQEKLRIAPGEITEDKRFSLELVNCIGACDAAPAMLINEALYGNLTPAEVTRIIDECS